MSGFEIRKVLEIDAELGESPAWSAEEQALYWLDIERRTFNRFDPETGENEGWQVPGIPGCFAFREDRGAVLACNNGYFEFDFATARFDKVCEAPFDPEVYRFNDGKADRQGRLWAGSIKFQIDIEGGPEGTFYRYEKGRTEAVIPGIMVPNGVSFSPDGRTMYRSDWYPDGRAIVQYDYDIATGTPSNERRLAALPGDWGVPDGSAVDTEGYYWCAVAAVPFSDKGMVARYAPDGTLDLSFEMPILNPTMVSFGGKDMKTLYITSASYLEKYMGLTPKPYSGSIFAIDAPVAGIAEATCARA